MARTNSKPKQNTTNSFKVGDALWGNVFKKGEHRDQNAIVILKNVPLFKGMRNTELKEFMKIMHRRKYRIDEKVFYEGEPGVGMYIVQEGCIAIVREDSNAESQELAELKPGEFFGELALLDESPRSATAVATEESKILGLFRPDLLGLIERKPRLGNKLLFELAHLIGERLKHTNEELQTVWARLDDSKVIT